MKKYLRTARLIFLVILLSCFVTALSFAQTKWTKYAGNPVLTGGDDETVIKDGDIYKMWYQKDEDYIGYATSIDGINWTVYSGNPVLVPGTPGSWDELEVDGPSVIKENGQYKMWYNAEHGDEDASSIGYATSIDGINWTKYEGNPLFEAGGGGSPSVIKDGGIYKMWYGGKNGMCYAISTDGINWTQYNGNPVIEGDFGCPSVIKNGGIYEMWYECGEDNGICYATSIDGINWNIYIGNPVLIEPGDPGDPSVIKDGTTYKMWYSPEIGDDDVISYAISEPAWQTHYSCSQSCEAQCGGDIACMVECKQYRQDCCQDGLDICQPQCPQIDPPSVHQVGFYNQDLAEAPLKVSGDELDVCFNYTGPVNILAGVLSDDFKHIWWLKPDCSLDSNYSQAVDSGNGLSCEEISMPVEGGYLFWLVSPVDLSHLDWENGIYDLLFYQFP